MVADKSLPMFDPDNQWVDRTFVRTLMRSFRLSPETIGKMLKQEPKDDWRVGPLDFRVRYAGNKAFVDVTDPGEGMHYVHAYWETFMSIVEAVAEEPEPSPTVKVEKELAVLKASLRTFVAVVAARVRSGMTTADLNAISNAAATFLDNV